MSLSTTVKSIQDIMRKDVGVDGDAQRVSQLAWMLFLKIYDDHESELEILRDNYKSPLPSRLRWRSWAADAEGITGDELTDFVNNDLFRNLKNLSATAPRAAVLRAAFEDAYNYMKSGTLLHVPKLPLPPVEAHFRNVRLLAEVLDAFFTTLCFPKNANLVFRRISFAFHRLVLSCVPD